MIGFLKFFPVNFRDASFESETRISFSETKRLITLDIMGNTITFKAPMKALDNAGVSRHIKCLPSANDLRFESMNSRRPQLWRYGMLFCREWSYWRAWFGGRSATSFYSISLIRREDEHVYHDMSFFHAKSFEYAITSYLNCLYGAEEYEGKARYRAPLDWETKSTFPLPNANFFVGGENPASNFIVPIADDLMMHFEFRYSGFVSGYPATAQMLHLSKEIIDTINIELSPETKKRCEEVRKESGYAEVTDTFPPLKWPMKFEDIE